MIQEDVINPILLSAFFSKTLTYLAGVFDYLARLD